MKAYQKHRKKETKVERRKMEEMNQGYYTYTYANATRKFPV
jgi:hypothetical protein